jgi:hypothetical protein
MENTDINRQLMNFAEKLAGTIFELPGGFAERAHNAAWKQVENEVLDVLRPRIARHAAEATQRLLDDANLIKLVEQQLESIVRDTIDEKLFDLVDEAVQRAVTSTNVIELIGRAAFDGIAQSLSPSVREQLNQSESA